MQSKCSTSVPLLWSLKYIFNIHIYYTFHRWSDILLFYNHWKETQRDVLLRWITLLLQKIHGSGSKIRQVTGRVKKVNFCLTKALKQQNKQKQIKIKMKYLKISKLATPYKVDETIPCCNVENLKKTHHIKLGLT